MTNNVNRRALLGGTLAAAVVAGASASTLKVGTHPDAALLEAFDGYVRAHRMFKFATEELLLNGGTNADHEPFYAAIDHYTDLLAGAEAQTVDGLRAQIRYIFAQQAGSIDAFDVAIYSQPPTPDLMKEIGEDFMLQMLWNMTGCGRLGIGA